MAAALDVSKSQVARDKAAGMPMDGAEAAKAWRLATLDMSRTKDGRIDRAPTTAGANVQAPALAADDIDDGEPGGDSVEPVKPDADEHTASFRQSRAAREKINLQNAQIDLQERLGKLVDVAEVQRLQFTASRITRDQVEMIPARVAAQLHSMVMGGADAHAVERHLVDACRKAMEDAATAVALIDEDDDAPD